ncbi:unnamed protein product, partial [Owenia fusiformis]
ISFIGIISVILSLELVADILCQHTIHSQLSTKRIRRSSPAECNDACSGFYLGCFDDRGQTCDEGGHNSPIPGPRDLPLFASLRDTSLTIESCLQMCRELDYKYASVQAGRYCHCGDKFGRYGRSKSTVCDRPCTGNGTQICGGSWANSIFTV